MAFSGQSFGGTGNSLFASRPSIFGNTNTQPTTGGLLANAPPLGSTQSQSATGAGTGTGMFGNFGQQNQQQQPAPASSPFGQPTAQPAATGGLFGQQTTTAQPTTTGIFSNMATQQQPATGGGLFGQTTTQQPTAGGSLFGQSTTQQPTTGGNLFGQSTTQQPTAGGGLFGQSTAQQQQSAQGGGLFGAPNQQQQANHSLFGNTGQQQQQPSTGLFGSSATQQTQPTGAFGASTTGGSFGGGPLFGRPQAPSTFGQPALGQYTQQPAQQAQNVVQFPFTKSAKFNDLPENVKQVLESIDTHIQGRVQISKDLHQRKLGEEPTKGQETIKQMHKDLLNASSVIRSDSRHTEDLKAKVDQAMQDTIVATRIIDAFRNPQSGTSYLKDHAGFPLEHFQRVTQQMTERLAWYKSTIEQIERRLSSSANQVQTPQSIAATLQAQNVTFVALASKTAALEAELQKLKVLYTQLWRAKTGSARDPFNDGDRVPESPSDLGFSGLIVK